MMVTLGPNKPEDYRNFSPHPKTFVPMPRAKQHGGVKEWLIARKKSPAQRPGNLLSHYRQGVITQRE
jgi:hypothetical protein